MRLAPTAAYRIDAFYLRLRAGVWWITGTGADGVRVRRSTKTSDLPRAKVILRDFVASANSDWRPRAAPTDTDWHVAAKKIAERHRFSARARGIPYELTAHDVYRMLRETDFRCSISGIALSTGGATNGLRGRYDPWGASIDRIDGRAGYVRDNVRITCIAANLAMNQFGFDVLLRLAKGVVRCAVSIAPEPEIPRVSDTEDCVIPFDDENVFRLNTLGN
jgi:hypothetical protein